MVDRQTLSRKGGTQMDLERKRILRLPELLRLTGLSKSRVYQMMAADLFPKNVMLSKRVRGWRASDIATWLETRPPADGTQE